MNKLELRTYFKISNITVVRKKHNATIDEMYAILQEKYDKKEPLLPLDKPLTIINEPTTFINEPTTFINEPTTFINEPMTVIDEKQLLLQQIAHSIEIEKINNEHKMQIEEVIRLHNEMIILKEKEIVELKETVETYKDRKRRKRVNAKMRSLNIVVANDDKSDTTDESSNINYEPDEPVAEIYIQQNPQIFFSKNMYKNNVARFKIFDMLKSLYVTSENYRKFLIEHKYQKIKIIKEPHGGYHDDIHISGYFKNGYETVESVLYHFYITNDKITKLSKIDIITV